jgi:hypothetical protein
VKWLREERQAYHISVNVHDLFPSAPGISSTNTAGRPVTHGRVTSFLTPRAWCRRRSPSRTESSRHDLLTAAATYRPRARSPRRRRAPVIYRTPMNTEPNRRSKLSTEFGQPQRCHLSHLRRWTLSVHTTLVRKSNEGGEEPPSRRDIETVPLVHSLGSPQSDNGDRCVRVTKKDGTPGVAETRAAKIFGPVH